LTSVQKHRSTKGQCRDLVEQEKQEELVVLDSDAVTDPDAVVVYSQVTHPAHLAVVCSWRHHALADVAVKELAKIRQLAHLFPLTINLFL